ncbi:homoprotocatechuate degradation operon regulator, HpaR [Mesorhizobium sp. 113-3-9]|nr:homoprotocatechuate degradation operon regulator HpaR [Mesorhizobium sp. B2-1-3A]BCG84641.1 homoprotocatechuate degradation operon regulator, HpaR [Mesorhizobium sp. 113-3-9]
MLPENSRRSLPMALLHAREAVMARFRPMLAAHDVTEQQWRVLRVLSEAGPVEATELADRASVLPPSLTRIIKALEGRKFITRNKAEGDGRRVVLTIAPAGSALIRALSPERRVIYDDIEHRFGHERLQQLLDLLDTLIEAES